MQTVLILTGLALAACGHAVANFRLGAVAWERADGRFPDSMRTPAPAAAALLLLWGAALALVPMLSA